MRGMRKSTVWLACLFILCVVAIGWRKLPTAFSVKDAMTEWCAEFGIDRIKDFLTWRSPGIALKDKAQERERLLAAEQQAFSVGSENTAWKQARESQQARTQEEEPDGAAASENEEIHSTETVTESSGAGKTDEKKPETVENTEQQGEESKKETKEERQTESEKSVSIAQVMAGKLSFPDYVQAAAKNNALCYSWKQLTDFDFLLEHFYQVHSSTTVSRYQLNPEKFLGMDLSIDRKKTGPQILIYHTHGSEYFSDSDPEDPDTLITGVGDVLADTLEQEYGYQVYHDTTVFPYNSSYSLGRKRVKEILEKNPGIQVIIDLHRDSAPDSHLVTRIDGKPVAQMMFFNGMSQTTKGEIASRENANRSWNLAFSLQLKLAAEQLYPGLTRKNYLKAYRYNMDLAQRYALIEVGAETNTLEEEIRAMKPLAQILHCVLQ